MNKIVQNLEESSEISPFVNTSSVLFAKYHEYGKEIVLLSSKTGVIEPIQIAGNSKNEMDLSKSIMCSNCSKIYDTQRLFDEHLIDDHEGKKAYQCKKCQIIFTLKHSFYEHIKSVHDEKKLLHSTYFDYLSNIPKN